MLARKVISTVVIAGGLLVAPALPSQAAPSGGCPNPPNRPVLTAVSTPATVSGAGSASISGSFTLNNCGIHNAKIHVQSRPLVNGRAAGSWTTFAVVTTAQNGLWKATLAPQHNVRFRAFFANAGSLPTTFAPASSLLVRTRITKQASTMSGCKIHLTGATTPAKANRKVFVQQRGARGAFQGWTTVGTTKTHSDGTYSTTAVAKCGQIYNMAVFIYGDSVNQAGRSGTTFGIKPHK